MMEGPTCTWIVAVCVFTEILLLTTAQVERMRNLALNKACDTSSRYNEYTKYSGNCSAAINGLINTYFQLSSSPPNCIHTSTSDNSPFWWVDLGQNFSVHEVTIYARTGSLKRMQCVRVSLDGREIYTFPSSGIANVTTGIYLHPPEHGRVVNITRNCISAGDSVPLLNICEVQIWGCTNGSWGDDCQYQCSPWCQGSGEDNYCDSDTGTCLKGCMLGYWGDNCTFTCGEGCNGSACNMSDGTCECRPGWESPLCQNCSDGYYNVSNDCQNTCGRGCNDICSRTDGTCQCQQGWQPPLCQSCSSGHYNVSNDCQDTCGEGCNDTCSRTNGTCLCHQGWQPPLCQDCLHGHFNVSNDCHNICGRGCHDTCKSTDGTCQCETGWESPMCQKCSIGHWGDNCSNSCAIGCQNAVCDAVNGTCQCKRGWAAPHCDYCSDNYYSVSSDCQNTCGEGCNNTCNRTDGTCLCRPGWDSPLCQRQSTSEITKTNAPVGAIVGSVVAAAVAVVIVIAILYLRRRQQHKGSRPRLQAFPDKFLSTSRQQLSTDDAESEIESEQSVAVHARKGETKHKNC
ncbi:multiple epidermal growth factor-like domains protein 11 [Pomacea canaliculata]|uniref:multiple epidermal growth factor-like domains protein 11 n=1 Tax=Pomacea canaliculata TaxID=400727 RepID=UPI000D73BC3E|nr:multiple epidermal growth factor-like domains protein 11 [Pomacea canaliculata]